MKIMNLAQGTDAWHKHRSEHFNASDASAMMGVSKYKTRNELLVEYATGARKDIDANTQRLFDKGHAAEAAARPIAEGIIGEELYPVTGSIEAYGLKLSASFDGLTMDELTVWEHKSLNKDLRMMQENGLDMHYHWQLAHQMLVSGAEKVLFMASDSVDHFETWIYRNENLISELVAGWKQFAEDLANYQHVEVVAEAVGRAPDAIPALRIEVTGMVTASNLDAFKSGAALMFSKINRDLQTDQDFADAEKTVKYCKEIEDNIESAKKHALSQTASIEELYRALDSVSAEARAVRLELDKLVKARKENIRVEIQREAETALKAHIDTINARLKLVQLPAIKADFAGVMKGKKTVQSLRDACDTELARAKIEASQLSEHIGSNLDFFCRVVQSHERHLFHDVATLVMKPQTDMVAIIKMRIREESDRIDAAAQAKLDAEKAAELNEPAARRIQVTIDGKPATHEQVAAAVGLPASVDDRKPSRPSDKQIIFAIAEKFNTDFHTASQWIKEIDFSGQEQAA